MKIWLLIILLIPSICFADSEATFSGKTAQAHIIQSQGISLRPRPYLDFEGISCVDLNGKTVCTGINPLNISTGTLTNGSQTISCGKILGEDGSFMLGEDGSYILQECPSQSFEFILGEDGTKMLGEDGSPILDESSHLLDFILGENGSKMLGEDGTNILGEDSINVVAGSSTPLFSTSTLSTSAWATANSSNLGTVYIGGSAVSSSNGIPLSIGEQNVYLPTYDLSQVYLSGTAGDGITFIYFGNSTPSVPSGQLQFLGSNLTFGGSDLTFNP